MKIRFDNVTNGVATGLFAIALGLITIATIAACAAWDKKTCAAIDLAHQACTVVKYLDDDGNEKQVSMTPEDAKQLGRAKAAARDGGAREAGAK